MWCASGQTPQMRGVMRGQLLDRAADAEALEAAQLGDLEVDVGDFAGVVDEDLDLAVTFEPGDRIDAYLLHQTLALLSSELARPKR